MLIYNYLIPLYNYNHNMSGAPDVLVLPKLVTRGAPGHT